MDAAEEKLKLFQRVGKILDRAIIEKFGKEMLKFKRKHTS
jgi:hypothetical protein